MAIQGKDQEAQQTGTTMGDAFANASARAAAGTTQQQKQAGGFSFRNIGSISRSPMGRTPASEVLSKMTKAIGDLFKENINQGLESFETTLIPIDMNNTVSLGISVLVITMRDKLALDTGVAYHTLILEGSAEPPQPRFENIGGNNVEVLRVAGDAADAVLSSTVIDFVNRQYPQTKLLDAGCCVVPRDFNVTDENAVYKLAANAAFAASSELETNRKDFYDLNLANAENDSNLVVRTTFNNPNIADAVGHPLRADVQIDFSAAPLTQQQNPQQAVERVSQVAHVSGFLDFVWAPMQPIANIYSAPTQQSFQRYAARFVMTSLESTNLLTIPAQLLALMPALSMRENDMWIQAFKPQTFISGEVDMHDIGAIGIEANFENNSTGVGSRIDTKSASFKPEHLGKLIAATVRPGLIMSLDVPECGPQTWYNGVFAAAAEGNPRANAAIIDAANHLTNGNFSKYFPSTGRIAVDENNRIHLGYYTDRQGVRKDIREIDYLAVMNLVGEKDALVIRDWSDSFLRSNYPLNQRLAARKRIISGLFSDVVITGFARRVTFEAAFVDALAKACQECRLAIRAMSPYADMMSYERATAQFSDQTIMSREATGIFNRGGFGQGGGFAGNRPFARW